MKDLSQCNICKSIVSIDQIDGQCKICGERTCVNCKRICDRCTRIVCMNHIRSKIVMRQQKSHLHELCEQCHEVW